VADCFGSPRAIAGAIAPPTALSLHTPATVADMRAAGVPTRTEHPHEMA